MGEDLIEMVGCEAIGSQKTHIRSEIKRILANVAMERRPTPDAANDILRLIKGVSGIEDFHQAVKSREMALAASVYESVRERIGKDFRSLANLAVLGNGFDFFRSPEDAMNDVVEQAGRDLDYFHDDLDRLQDFLANDPGTILYLTDNAGEIFFDLPLFQHIQKKARRTVLVVKGGPSLNDLSVAEIESLSFKGMFHDIMNTGTDGCGIDWRGVSPEFVALVEKADLIVSKGMANFETVYFRDLKIPAFFLFMTKCQVVADYFGAPLNSAIGLWKD
ncbi:conserved hypothetical protein [delta proteobacterium NaphS2]|nr:conserved hypothetical protein [delta proteobacterium NaphS2]